MAPSAQESSSVRKTPWCGPVKLDVLLSYELHFAFALHTLTLASIFFFLLSFATFCLILLICSFVYLFFNFIGYVFLGK